MIIFVDVISADIEEKMRKELVKYEKSYGIDVNYKKFSLILNDDHSGETIGVLSAYTAFSEIYIEDMWVDINYRFALQRHTTVNDIHSVTISIGDQTYTAFPY